MSNSTSFILTLLFAALLFLTAVHADISPCFDDQIYQNGSYGAYPVQTFFSDPDVIAPVANVITPPQDGISPSRHIVWSPIGPNVVKQAPRILNAHDLSLVYQAPSSPGLAIGADIQRCNNTDYLTWWSGDLQDLHMAGYYQMMDSDYNIVYNFTAIGLALGDAHELFITPQCTAVFTAYQPIPYDLRHWDIEDGWLLDSLFQEIDIATNTLLFQWRASDHIYTEDSYIYPAVAGQGHDETRAFDFFHINSVEKDSLGNYLVSSRHMHSLYYLDGQDGSIYWTLGGKRNDFTDRSNGSATDFAWQHHARWADEEHKSITLFDNSWAGFYDMKPAHNTSRGLLLSLDQSTREVTLEQTYTALSNVSVRREGSTQQLLDAPGNILVGYGSEPAFTEFSADGKILHDVRFGPVGAAPMGADFTAGADRETADNYRALKVNWSGTPTWNPKIAAGPPSVDKSASTDCSVLELNKSTGTLPVNGGVMSLASSDASLNNTAYFSWNGATDIKDWVILGSNTTADLTGARHFWQRVARKGFESSVLVAGAATYIRAVALSADDVVLGASPVIDMRNGSVVVGAVDVNLQSVNTWHRAMLLEAAIQKRAQLKVMLGVAFGGFLCFVLIGMSIWFCSQACRGRSIRESLPRWKSYIRVRGDPVPANDYEGDEKGDFVIGEHALDDDDSEDEREDPYDPYDGGVRR